MSKLLGLFLTLIAGLFFLLGGIISLKFKNKDKLNAFSVSLAFVIILDLIFIDLFPEILESLETISLASRIILILIFTILGFLILKGLDFFIPDHHHDHHDNESNIKEHKSHIKHIGTLTVISLILHNILEGLAIFGMSLNDFKIGLFVCVSVALHNIPLGTHIFSSMDVKKNKNLIFILTISSLIGGVIYLLFGNISETILGLIMCITLGMLIYIALFELLSEIIHNYHHKETKLGILLGVIIFIISLFI